MSELVPSLSSSMLGRLCSSGLASFPSFARSSVRTLSSASNGGGNDGEDKKSKGPAIKDIIDDDVLNAVNAVTENLHSGNPEEKKIARNTLLGKLMEVEKQTFNEATAVQTEELLADKSVMDVLKDVRSQTAMAKKPPRAAEQRQARRGLLLLRQEIIYQAIQDGYDAVEARRIAERAVDEAERRLAAQRIAARKPSETEKTEQKEQEELSEKEAKLFNQAYQLAEKVLYQEESIPGVSTKKTIRPDPKLPSLFNHNERLNVFTNTTALKEHSLGFWAEWDQRAARIATSRMGPENAVEEQIEWTKHGKMWPYPIDNEFLLGEEANVPFFEHVFLERHLSKLGLPKEGPIAHFMELVCVGLSKNPYMTAAKKRDHLEWFAKYFNAEKQKLVHKLHEQEAQAAASA